MADTTNINRYAPEYVQSVSTQAGLTVNSGMRHRWMPSPDGVEFGTAAHRAAQWLLNWFDNGMHDNGYALNNVSLSQKFRHAAIDEGWTRPEKWWPSAMAPLAVRILLDTGNERIVPGRVWIAITESVGLGNLPASRPEPSLQRAALDHARDDTPRQTSDEEGSRRSAAPTDAPTDAPGR